MCGTRPSVWIVDMGEWWGSVTQESGVGLMARAVHLFFIIIIIHITYIENAHQQKKKSDMNAAATLVHFSLPEYLFRELHGKNQFGSIRLIS